MGQVRALTSVHQAGEDLPDKGFDLYAIAGSYALETSHKEARRG